ncbi:MAG: type IX secretion system membrane protein PorP/SprF [Bacteroidetes bacterium]|nr:type IX secretion system membrane protein PorP/SprF [Bacteroidota bacterium]
MKKTGFFLSLLIFAANVFSQQEPQFSHNIFNKLVINPGSAGYNQAICVGVLGRKQWSGFVGAPQTGLINVDAPVRILHGGAGLSLFSDKLGIENNTGAKLAYAFRTTIGVGQLGIGASFGYMSKTLDSPRLVPITNDGSDQVIPKNVINDNAMNFGAGLYYNTDIFYLGFSVSQISESEISYNVPFKLARHYYLIGAYNFRLGAILELEPSLFLKSDGAGTPQIDINFLAIYNDFFFGGISYRYQDAIVPLIGLQWNNFKVSYAYDINTSELRGYNSGSHELFLGYCFKLPEGKTAQKYRNVRFL